MEVILREHVNNLGRIGDIVVVKPGYARNFLFPQSLAVRATQENKAMIEAKRKELEAIEEGHRQEARERAKPFAGIALTLSVAVTEEVTFLVLWVSVISPKHYKTVVLKSKRVKFHAAREYSADWYLSRCPTFLL